METWRVYNADDLSKSFQGTVEECDRWCKENHLKHTGWCEINPVTDNPMTIKDMLIDEG